MIGKKPSYTNLKKYTNKLTEQEIDNFFTIIKNEKDPNKITRMKEFSTYSGFNPKLKSLIQNYSHNENIPTEDEPVIVDYTDGLRKSHSSSSNTPKGPRKTNSPTKGKGNKKRTKKNKN